MTFREFTGLWSDKFVDKNLAETSAFNYKYHSTTKLTPILGDIQMDKIKTLDIVTLLDELSKKLVKPQWFIASEYFEVYSAKRCLGKLSK